VRNATLAAKIIRCGIRVIQLVTLLLTLHTAAAPADNYIRFGMRIGAVVLPFLIAGLNDHMPGDYCQQVVNSDPAAWQPFK
jgi:hypothetical protein